MYLQLFQNKKYILKNSGEIILSESWGLGLGIGVFLKAYQMNLIEPGVRLISNLKPWGSGFFWVLVKTYGAYTICYVTSLGGSGAALCNQVY